MIELASALLTASGPLITTTCVLRLLKNRPDRDLVLPMPMMLLVVLGAQNRGAGRPLPAQAWRSTRSSARRDRNLPNPTPRARFRM